MRDSLSALDQAIACCGAKLTAPEVRALLGAFSLESLERISEALADGNSKRMLEVVDELERNGQNLQHFSRELARYFRNLLVARISGAETRLIAASVAQRQRMAEIAGRFSEEDLTRYLSLSLELFKDLQASLQPRFHMEIGLVRLVQAGKLLPIEQALAGLTSSTPGSPSAPPSRSTGGPPPPPPPPAPAPRRTGPSPFEMDSAKRGGSRPPEPQNSGANALAPQAAAPPAPMVSGDPRQQLFQLLHDRNHAHLADAVEHANISAIGGDLNISAPQSYGLYFRDPAFEECVREVFGRSLRVKFTPGEAAAATGRPMAAAPPPAAAQEAKQRRARFPIRSASAPRRVRRRVRSCTLGVDRENTRKHAADHASGRAGRGKSSRRSRPSAWKPPRRRHGHSQHGRPEDRLAGESTPKWPTTQTRQDTIVAACNEAVK